MIQVLGAVIILTGLLHVFGGFRTGEDRAYRRPGLMARNRSLTSFLLGVFEIILGLLLFLEPLDRGTRA